MPFFLILIFNDIIDMKAKYRIREKIRNGIRYFIIEKKELFFLPWEVITKIVKYNRYIGDFIREPLIFNSYNSALREIVRRKKMDIVKPKYIDVIHNIG